MPSMMGELRRKIVQEWCWSSYQELFTWAYPLRNWIECSVLTRGQDMHKKNNLQILFCQCMCYLKLWIVILYWDQAGMILVLTIKLSTTSALRGYHQCSMSGLLCSICSVLGESNHSTKSCLLIYNYSCCFETVNSAREVLRHIYAWYLVQWAEVHPANPLKRSMFLYWFL